MLCGHLLQKNITHMLFFNLRMWLLTCQKREWGQNGSCTLFSNLHYIYDDLQILGYKKPQISPLPNAIEPNPNVNSEAPAEDEEEEDETKANHSELSNVATRFVIRIPSLRSPFFRFCVSSLHRNRF